MKASDCLQKLKSIGEEKLLNGFDALNEVEKKALLNDIENLDLKVLKEQKKILSKKKDSQVPIAFKPIKRPYQSQNQSFQDKGQELISKGQVGCLVVAGGQGTRLKFDHPKGLFPVTPVLKKSLFQLLSEKVLKASDQAGKKLPLAIMTSSINEEETKQFFKENRFFGMEEKDLDFFTQPNLPVLDNQGSLFLESKCKIAKAPDGNGSSLQAFYKSGVFSKWKQKGIRYLVYVLIDNPLADPFDKELIGMAADLKSDVSIKCVERIDPDEKVGVFIQDQDKTKVVEYSEFPKSLYEAKENGEFLFPYANISYFCFDMNFIESLADINMPMHLAFKSVPIYSRDKESILTNKDPFAWKFEKFIFDVLPYAKVDLLLEERKFCYSPLKNKEGRASLKTVQEDLMALDKIKIESVTETKAPDIQPFEIDPAFYYPTPEIKKKWRKRSIPLKPYIPARD